MSTIKIYNTVVSTAMGKFSLEVLMLLTVWANKQTVWNVFLVFHSTDVIPLLSPSRIRPHHLTFSMPRNKYFELCTHSTNVLNLMKMVVDLVEAVDHI